LCDNNILEIMLHKSMIFLYYLYIGICIIVFRPRRFFNFVVDSYFVHYVKKSFLLTHVKHLLILRSLSESLFKVPLVSFIIFSLTLFSQHLMAGNDLSDFNVTYIYLYFSSGRLYIFAELAYLVYCISQAWSFYTQSI
jgi:hypothetical protein